MLCLITVSAVFKVERVKCRFIHVSPQISQTRNLVSDFMCLSRIHLWVVWRWYIPHPVSKLDSTVTRLSLQMSHTHTHTRSFPSFSGVYKEKQKTPAWGSSRPTPTNNSFPLQLQLRCVCVRSTFWALSIYEDWLVSNSFGETILLH